MLPIVARLWPFPALETLAPLSHGVSVASYCKATPGNRTAQEAAPGSGTVPSWQGITCDPIWVFFAPPFTMTVAEEEGLLLPSNTIHVLEPPVSCVFIPYFVDSWLGKWVLGDLLLSSGDLSGCTRVQRPLLSRPG